MAFKSENNERADRAEHALDSLSDGVTDESITDLLTNLRHLCDREGYDFDALNNMAEIHYGTEY